MRKTGQALDRTATRLGEYPHSLGYEDLLRLRRWRGRTENPVLPQNHLFPT